MVSAMSGVTIKMADGATASCGRVTPNEGSKPNLADKFAIDGDKFEEIWLEVVGEKLYSSNDALERLDLWMAVAKHVINEKKAFIESQGISDFQKDLATAKLVEILYKASNGKTTKNLMNSRWQVGRNAAYRIFNAQIPFGRVPANFYLPITHSFIEGVINSAKDDTIVVATVIDPTKSDVAEVATSEFEDKSGSIVADKNNFRDPHKILVMLRMNGNFSGFASFPNSEDGKYVLLVDDGKIVISNLVDPILYVNKEDANAGKNAKEVIIIKKVALVAKVSIDDSENGPVTGLKNMVVAFEPHAYGGDRPKRVLIKTIEGAIEVKDVLPTPTKTGEVSLPQVTKKGRKAPAKKKVPSLPSCSEYNPFLQIQLKALGKCK